MCSIRRGWRVCCLLNAMIADKLFQISLSLSLFLPSLFLFPLRDSHPRGSVHFAAHHTLSLIRYKQDVAAAEKGDC